MTEKLLFKITIVIIIIIIIQATFTGLFLPIKYGYHGVRRFASLAVPDFISSAASSLYPQDHLFY